LNGREPAGDAAAFGCKGASSAAGGSARARVSWEAWQARLDRLEEYLQELQAEERGEDDITEF
jgi:hypothetical protein